MRLRYAFAALALLAGFARADAPVAKITGPLSVRPGENFHLDAVESVSEKPITWKLNGKPSPFRVLDQGDRKGVVSLGVGLSAGSTMRFVAVAKGMVGGELDVDVAIWDVLVDGDAPKPPPGPGPNPGPTPDPIPPTPGPIVGERLWVVYIADCNARVQDFAKQSRLKGSQAILTAAKDNDAIFRWYQSDEPDLQGYGWLDKATASGGPGLPVAFIVTKSNKVVATLKAPDEAAIVAELRKIRGK